MSNASEVYTRLLLPKGHGCPIWCPEPDDNLSPAYRESGVRIGHVGRIVPDGGFDPLFNICFAENHPINSDGVPDGFEQLALGNQDVTVRNNQHNRGSHICSKPLEKRDTNIVSELNVWVPFVDMILYALNGMLLDMHIRIRTNPAYRFTSKGTTEGAILLLPEGSSRKDLRQRLPNFEQYAIQNALRWYQFANQHLGRQIPNGSLILVTGCDMASSWAIASFSDVSPDMDVKLSFCPSDRGTYSWETNVSASATVRTSLGLELISASNGGVLSIWDQPRLNHIMASTSRTVDASHGIFNEVGGNQIYNITNHIALPAISDRCKSWSRTSMDPFNSSSYSFRTHSSQCIF